MLSSLYELNKSVSKKVVFGIDLGKDGLGEVDIRLSGSDFAIIRFTRKNWTRFVANFDHIRKIFATSLDNRQKIILLPVKL